MTKRTEMAVNPEELFEALKNEEIQLDEFLTRMYTFSGGREDDYVRYMTKLANSKRWKKEFSDLMEDDRRPWGCRVMAFYALCIRHRRRWDFTKLREVVECGENLFGDEPLVRVQKMVCLKTCPNNRKRDYAKALEIWRGLDSNLKSQPAFIQAHADTIARCFEDGVMNATDEADEEQWKLAVTELEEAIKIRGYPKYYATSARLYAVAGDYSQALKLIMYAIDKEESDISDYELRMIEYRAILSRVEAAKHYAAEREKLEGSIEQIRRVRDEVDKSKYDNLAFLGFFAALLAFIVGSFNVAQMSQSSGHLAQLILVIAGAMIIAFAAFSILLPSKFCIARSAAMAAFGTVIIVCSLVFVPI